MQVSNMPHASLAPMRLVSKSLPGELICSPHTQPWLATLVLLVDHGQPALYKSLGTLTAVHL